MVVEKREGKSLLGKHKRRWENSIKMDIKETDFEVVEWTELAQDKVQ
jgi:hypothetical protein